MFTIEIDETALRNAWGSAVNLVRGGISEGVVRGVREGADEARRRHTFKNQSGDLERSIEGNALGWSGETMQGEIVARAKYASYVEEGTPAHLIAANRARALSFVWKGEPMIRRWVSHPGTRAQPFMGLAYEKCEAVIVREIEIGIAKAQAALE